MEKQTDKLMAFNYDAKKGTISSFSWDYIDDPNDDELPVETKRKRETTLVLTDDDVQGRSVTLSDSTVLTVEQIVEAIDLTRTLSRTIQQERANAAE